MKLKLKNNFPFTFLLSFLMLIAISSYSQTQCPITVPAGPGSASGSHSEGKNLSPCDANNDYKKNSDGADDNGSNNSHGPQNPANDFNNNGDPTWPIDVTVPGDPNEMISPDGFDTTHWVSVKDNMGFTVLFENDPKIATAPAHNVYIYYPVNEHQDMSTFRLGDFGFNEDVFTVPINTSYYTKRLDLRDSLGLYVDVTAGIDVVNKRAFWIFEAIDPSTGLSPINPELGFLPVRDSSITGFSDTIAVKGEGFVSFTMKPKVLSLTRDTIFARAQIVFDTNDTIPTNIEFNTIDAKAPVSHITTTSIINHAVTLHISAIDDTNGSGVKNYDLYVAQDSANYVLYLANATDSIVKFTGVSGSRYYFFTLAQDNVGNREALKGSPDAILDLSNVWYADADSDGFGNFSADSISLLQPVGYIEIAGDCNDLNPLINPLALEICNGYDDNCDGKIDEGCPGLLSLKLFIQGFYIGNHLMTPVLFTSLLSADSTACDSITIELHDPLNLETSVMTVSTLLYTDGHASFIFPPTVTGNFYYIVIRHRNSIETWSKLPLTFTPPVVNFDFTSY